MDGQEATAQNGAVSEETLLEQLRAKHGEIASWRVPGFGLVVAAAPANPREFHRLINTVRTPGADHAAAIETFALACVVHPTRDEAKKIFTRKPAFAALVSARGQEFAGGDIEELGKD